MAIDFQTVSDSTANELRRVAGWLEDRTTQEYKNIERKSEEKTRGDEIRLLANFPESKPFWEDSYHKLECFACDFSQETGSEPLKNLRWMTKRIRKNNKTHIVAFCPACTAGDPWTIHGEEDYTLIRINMESKVEPITKQKKQKLSEGWLKRPQKIPYYRDKWSLAELYDKPMDWYGQETEYDEKMKIYEKKKEEYEAFCSQKLEQIVEIETPTSSEEVEREKLRKRKINEEKFLEFASKRHPEHPAYAKYIENQRLKKQKMSKRDGDKKNSFNSPPPQEKENIQNHNKEASIITD
jgi:hypothetical protein